MQLRHICEVCGVEEVLTPDAAYEAGWDYPLNVGTFRVVSPRACPHCSIKHTAWWAIIVDGYTSDMVSPKQRATVARILGEPNSVAVPSTDDIE
jgi:hypothetical protein